jgi:hypothetical protein
MGKKRHPGEGLRFRETNHRKTERKNWLPGKNTRIGGHFTYLAPGKGGNLNLPVQKVERGEVANGWNLVEKINYQQEYW